MTKNLDILQICENRINSDFLDENDKTEWKFIKAIAQNDQNEVLAVLGFDKEKILKKTEKYTGKIRQTTTSTKKTHADRGYPGLSEAEAEEFFTKLAKDPKKKGIHQEEGEDKVDNQYVITETIQKNLNWNAGIEKYIKDNILIGNIEGAVDTAIKHGRIAEAFLLAYSNGQDLFKSTLKQYFTACNEGFVKTVIKSLVEGVHDLVKNHPLEDWKECVALCYNYTNGDKRQFNVYMEELGNRLISERNNNDQAILCYIISSNFQKILENFAFRTENIPKGSIDYSIYLLRTIEKLTVLRLVTGNYESSPIVDRFIFEVSNILHTSGRDTVILNLLSINEARSFECLVLRDRILHSNSELAALYPTKKLPF